MNKSIFIIIFILFTFQLFCQNNAPIASNISVSQRTDGSKIIDIYYDVIDADGDTLTISLYISSDDGANWDITPTQVTGDIGSGILSGNNKHIVWNAGTEIENYEGTQFKFRVIADDEQSETVTDYDGNVYSSIQIGEQLWMVENLKVTHFRNGDPIPHETNNSTWASLSTGAYCYYDNNTTNLNVYGNLYNWYAIYDSRNIAPEGWHIPSDDEIKVLEVELGMTWEQANTSGWRGTNEGSKLSGRADLWTNGNLDNDPEFDSSGFSFLPGGYRSADNGGYDFISSHGNFWSSSESGGNALRRHFYYTNASVYRSDHNKRSGFSVRCVKDVTVTDYDGNVYSTIQIGDQLWMAENLKVTHYGNGDPILHLTENGAWTSSTDGAYCVYDNNSSNADTYGNLYNWYAIDDARNIAPEGWHVPTDEEIKELEMALGMSQIQADSNGWRGTNEGSKLAGRSDLWNDGVLENNAEFGTSGFSFLPGGYRYYSNGDYRDMSYYGSLWSSSVSGDLAWYRLLLYDYTSVNRNNGGKHYGYSIRCVKDSE